jgi:hypothetical protein
VLEEFVDDDKLVLLKFVFNDVEDEDEDMVDDAEEVSFGDSDEDCIEFADDDVADNVLHDEDEIDISVLVFDDIDSFNDISFSLELVGLFIFCTVVFVLSSDNLFVRVELKVSRLSDTVGGNGFGIGFSTGFVRPSPISCTIYLLI